MNHPSFDSSKIGVLLTNLGTPDAPTPKAVRRYLKEFLWDPRVVEIPRFVWWLILHGIVLQTRPTISAKKYQQIWTEAGSPLRVILEQQAAALRQHVGDKIEVITAMRYGNPSIKAGLEQLREQKVQKLLVFPLYPQYSATTTATTFDEVARILASWRWQPELRTIHGYHDNDDYIKCIVTSITQFWQQQGKTEKLLFSFHGLPKQFLLKGDPYHCFCQKTVRLVAEQLQLDAADYAISFQSRLGKAQWLQPYTSDMLSDWGRAGVKSVAVLCPGFSADCLETLEEVKLLHQEAFKQAGGKEFYYIPALNDDHAHINMLYNLIRQHTLGW